MSHSSINSSPMELFEPRARVLMDAHPQDDGTDDDNLASGMLSSAPRLSTKYNSFNIIPSKNDEAWTVREVTNGEEQLYARGKSVYWTRNSLIIKSFNFTDQVVKVFWTKFSRQEHVCMALVSGLSIFDQVGRHYQILLPFAYQDMYPSSHGLFIDRICDPADDPSLPTIFALTYPTREITPLIFKIYPRTASQHSRVSLTYCPTSVSIVGCHEKLPYCLMYSSNEMQHSIWKIRNTTDEEIDDFKRNSDESTANTFANHQSSCSFRTEGISHGSLNLSSRQKSSLLHQSNHSSSTINFSPRVDFKSRHSGLGSLAASRLGIGGGPLTAGETNINATNIRSINSAHTFNTISTPNRERMINYLRDNIEEVILPELVLEQVWVEPCNNSLKARKFFTMQDLVGENYVVIVVPASNQLKVMKSEMSSGKEILTLSRPSHIIALDAAPIPAMNMMVVIDINRNFVLYSGFDRVTQISVPQYPATANIRNVPTSSPTTSRTPGVELSPIQSSSARKRTSLAERSSLGSELSFQQIFQTLSPVPHANKYETKTSSPVCSGEARLVEHVIGHTLVVSTGRNQRARFTIPSVWQTSYVRQVLQALKLSVSKDLGLFITTRWYQTRRALTQPEHMRALEELALFKYWFLTCIGVEKDLFSCEGDSIILELTHRLGQLSPSKKSRRTKDIEFNPMITNIYSLFYAIHLVFEDLLINKLNYEIASSLAELLIVLACMLKLSNYQEYYWLKFPHLQEKFHNQRVQLSNLIPKVELLHKPSFMLIEPPSVVDFISKLVTLAQLEQIHMEDEVIRPYPNIQGVTEQSSTVIALFCEMFNVDRDSIILEIPKRADDINSTVILERRPQRSRKADERVVKLLVKLEKDRNFLSRLPQGFNLYIWDAILNCRESPPPEWCESCYDLIGRMDLVNLVCGRAANPGKKLNPSDADDETLKLLFPDDIRVSEAHMMLASDSPIEFSVVQRQGATEEESRDETHRHLYLLNVRTMAMPVGRGAICLRTYSPVIGESFEVPRLELSGRALSEDRPIEYNHDISVYPWPYFHNGVAAGLTICASSSNNIIDSTWINYNRPRSNIAHGPDLRDLTAPNINNEHAGFLFALGLNGHLEKLSLMALHDYLCQNNDLTKLAILLGMSAAKRGSRDTNIIKVLSIHVDALLPPNSTELDVSAPVHAASIIGVGLLFQGSGDSHISRVLLDEIGRLPGPEANSHIDRESYSLSAGLAFGLVNLCKGGSTTISSSDQLRLYMLGGMRKPLTIAQKKRYFKQDCHRGEEEYINTHITSPGGTLGLGLMYHRSSNESVANWMRGPDTQTLLEYVRPDFLMLRMISYGLIMWNEIKPTEEYIDSHMPKIVSMHAFRRNSSPSPSTSSAATTVAKSSIDYELISQAYCNIVAGCCMAIALKFAGTADKEAYNTIYKHTKSLITLSNKTALAEQAGRPCIESCLNVLVTSLAVVMAGTGDLGVMRVCRYLRSRLTQSCVFYGSYMAVHLALGILFLGACRYSLSTSPDSIGALICALYPIYPNHSSDNRYHLQALRHLYVLAAEFRLLIPRDILTDKPVYVNLKVRRRQEDGKVTELNMKAPCLMPKVDLIESISIDDDRYWRIEITNKKALTRCLFQEQGYMSVKQKAHSSNNQLVSNIETYIIQNMTHGVLKCRKSSALNECVKEDRVEQYSALNELITRARRGDKRFWCLVLEQIRLALSLAKQGNIADKINLLKPLVGEFELEFKDHDVEDGWVEYMSRKIDWTNTDPYVAYFISLNDLKDWAA